MAEVTREEFEELKKRVEALENSRNVSELAETVTAPEVVTTKPDPEQ